MSLTTGQIVSEKWKHSNNIYLVWLPTPDGDYHVIRVMSGAYLYSGLAAANNYLTLCGIWRGRCYQGSRKASTEHDAQDAGWSTGTSLDTGYSNTVSARSKSFNKPAWTPTKCRIWFMGGAGYDDEVTVKFYDGAGGAGSQVGETTTINTGQSIYYSTVQPSSWITVPAGTASVKVANKDSTFVFMGLDWIDTATEVSPDTAGSMLYDGYDGTATMCTIDACWGHSGTGGTALAGVRNTVEMALWINFDGAGYSSTYQVGGITHQGIDSCTVALKTQDGTNAPAAWSPSLGDKLACSLFNIGLTTGKAHVRANNVTTDNQWGTFDGRLTFTAAGVGIWHEITATAATDVFIAYDEQLPLVDKSTWTAAGLTREGPFLFWPMEGTTPRVYDDTTQISSAGPACHSAVAYEGRSIFRMISMRWDDLGRDSQYTTVVGKQLHMATSSKGYHLLYNNTTTPLDLGIGDKIYSHFCILIETRTQQHPFSRR